MTRPRYLLLAAIPPAVIALASCGVSGSATTTSSPVTATTATTTSDLPAATTTPGTTAGVPATTVDDEVAAAAGAFVEWVGALDTGDLQLAWDLMAPSSQLAIGSFAHFEDMGSGLTEGWGSWAAVEDPRYALEQDDAGRTLVIVSGVVHPEGMTEQREVGIPLIESDGVLRLSPFEEFGNVATGLEQEAAGVAPPPVPAESGEGRRIVYSNSEQRVWLVEADGSIFDSYLVSGKKGVPAPGDYAVYSKSELASAGHGGITMHNMVRFAHGTNLPIGFHSIPNDGNGRPLQTEEQLGEYHSAGCVRQSPGEAAELYEWAQIGTVVVVLA
jgi:hypothetical protein